MLDRDCSESTEYRQDLMFVQRTFLIIPKSCQQSEGPKYGLSEWLNIGISAHGPYHLVRLYWQIDDKHTRDDIVTQSAAKTSVRVKATVYGVLNK